MAINRIIKLKSNVAILAGRELQIPFPVYQQSIICEVGTTHYCGDSHVVMENVALGVETIALMYEDFHVLQSKKLTKHRWIIEIQVAGRDNSSFTLEVQQCLFQQRDTATGNKSD
ncbi:Hypothetical protein [Corynebacterium glutamicum ATCC 13032]|uniref:Uncharacterized protein n=1 Tax=Corynebacterium glutamicum (strain ATCC 13032 / DSM 20300 / JCM 1318 / BCRC 11384 / CCUG 27702 / LMG 3730 / NBRC 12168 / NCIMB 10025 / NRRL B-2784 / 534) TaxID=196627 RepID=Q8NRA0_CORGL|nr:Hypothetical protein [Corynebacterium glutamicum ATCC 13032]